MRFSDDSYTKGQSLLTMWDEVLREYSKCELPFPSDKLIAVSGVARELATYFGRIYSSTPRYYAGIWFQYLPSLLLCRTIRGAKPIYRPRQY